MFLTKNLTPCLIRISVCVAVLGFFCVTLFVGAPQLVKAQSGATSIPTLLPAHYFLYPYLKLPEVLTQTMAMESKIQVWAELQLAS